MATDYNLTFNQSNGNRPVSCNNQSSRDESVFRGDRLETLLKEQHISQSELGRRVGVSQATIWKLINEPSQGSKYLHRIAAELSVSPAYLMDETEDPNAPVAPSPQEDDVWINEIDLAYGMGATYLDEGEVKSVRRKFSRAWLRMFTDSPLSEIYCARGLGDSMMPTILDSDILMIDTAQQSLRVSDQIWAVAWGNVGAVKRLRPTLDGGLELISDNPNVPNMTAHDGEVHILGRVVAIVRKM